MRVEQQIEYEAKSDAEAINIARERLGRDAVILSSRPVKLGGVLGLFKRDALWITAGVLIPDQEDMLKESHDRMVAFQHLLEVRRAVGGEGAVVPAEPLVTTAFTPPPQGTVAVTAAAQAYESNSSRQADQKPSAQASPMAKDVDEIKMILCKVLDRLDGAGAQESLSGLDDNGRLLVDAGVDKDIASEISDMFAKSSSSFDFYEWLAGRIPTMGAGWTNSLGGKRVLFAGPTGVGKTTTIAKLAATQSLWEHKKVVMMTADTYRIAAVEQLRTYAKILSVPIEIIADPHDADAALRKHADADLILLDTAGRSHFDDGRLDELKVIYDAFEPDSVHLVVASNIRYRDMLDVIERMGVIPLSALLFTKLDETHNYGTILNVLHDFNLSLSFFTVGQDVPNDIEIARGDRFVNLLTNRESLIKKESSG